MQQVLTSDLIVGYSPFVGSIVAVAIKKLLRRRGLRIKDLMVKTGWSRPTVSRHVNGKRSPNDAQRDEYARIIGVDRAELDSIWGPLADGDDFDPSALTETAAAAGMSAQELLVAALAAWKKERRPNLRLTPAAGKPYGGPSPLTPPENPKPKGRRDR